MHRQNRGQNRLQNPRPNRQQAGELELFPGISRLTRSAATAYDRARYRWSIGAERWRTRRDEQELRAQGSLIHLDFRLSFTVLALWAFTAAALTVGTWRVVHPLACVLIALLGCLAILLFFPPRAVMPYILLFRTTGQLVFLACIVGSGGVFVRYGGGCIPRHATAGAGCFASSEWHGGAGSPRGSAHYFGGY